jgi:pimeloyl-ACP methyl ester carboxylesterase
VLADLPDLDRSAPTQGKNDFIFPAEGAFPYLDDLVDVDFHLLDTGHFALEEDGVLISHLIHRFLKRELRQYRSHD